MGAPSLWKLERDENDDSRAGAIRGLLFALPASAVFWILIVALLLALTCTACHERVIPNVHYSFCDYQDCKLQRNPECQEYDSNGEETVCFLRGAPWTWCGDIRARLKTLCENETK